MISVPGPPVFQHVTLNVNGPEGEANCRVFPVVHVHCAAHLHLQAHV